LSSYFKLTRGISLNTNRNPWVRIRGIKNNHST